jgi:hypothetical protein
MALIPMLALHRMPMKEVETLDVPRLGTRRIVLRSHFRGKQAHRLLAPVTTVIRDAVSRIQTGQM